MRVVIAAGICAAVICASLPASAEKIRSIRVGNWKGGAYTSNSTGNFLYCSASASYKSGIHLYFGVTAKLHWWMQMRNSKWNLKVGQSYPVEYWVDKGRAYNGKAKAVSKRSIRVTLPAKDSLFGVFRRGKLLEILSSKKRLAFKLTSTNKMLSRLLSCASKYRKRNVASNSSSSSDNPFANSSSSNSGSSDSSDSSSSNPFGSSSSASSTPPKTDSDNPFGNSNSSNASPPKTESDNPFGSDNKTVARIPDSTPPSTSGSGPTGNERAEATAKLATLLATAGVSNFKLIPASQTKGGFKRHDSVWKAKGLIGSLRIIAGRDGLEPNSIKSRMIGSDAKTCKGSFASGAMPSRDGDSNDAIHLFTACEGGKRDWTAYYATLPRPAGGYYLLMVVGTMNNAETVKQTGVSMREIALSGVTN